MTKMNALIVVKCHAVHYIPEHASRKRSRGRCGDCNGCRKDDCGLCSSCKDMKKFGGPAKKKKACKLRICTQTYADENSPEQPKQTSQVDITGTINKLSSIVDKFRKLFHDILIPEAYWLHVFIPLTGHKVPSNKLTQSTLTKENIVSTTIKLNISSIMNPVLSFRVLEMGASSYPLE